METINPPQNFYFENDTWFFEYPDQPEAISAEKYFCSASPLYIALVTDYENDFSSQLHLYTNNFDCVTPSKSRNEIKGAINFETYQEKIGLKIVVSYINSQGTITVMSELNDFIHYSNFASKDFHNQEI